jgi:hypothetical protein
VSGASANQEAAKALLLFGMSKVAKGLFRSNSFFLKHWQLLRKASILRSQKNLGKMILVKRPVATPAKRGAPR